MQNHNIARKKWQKMIEQNGQCIVHEKFIMRAEIKKIKTAVTFGPVKNPETNRKTYVEDSK